MSGARDLPGRSWRGQGNGIGLAVGAVHIGPNPVVAVPVAHPGDPQILAAAIETAIADLQALMAAADPHSRNILEFQVEMLSDPAIRDIGSDRADDGTGTVLAWVSAIEDYIAGFESSDDDDICARAVDVIDIRNRVLGALNGTRADDFPAGSIFVGADIAPSLFLTHDWTSGGGIALSAGSTASHVAMLARARSVPMVVGLGPVPLENGMRLMVDGIRGIVLPEPTETDIAEALCSIEITSASAAKSNLPPDGEIKSGMTCLVNIGHPAELAAVSADCAGIGLLRSEFLMSSTADLANEERQYRLYGEALSWAGERPVTVRLLDLGGDKALGGFGANERNPFLGMRGIRLLLAHPDLLRVQARALLRAAVLGNLKVMLPMVTVASEITVTRRIFAEEAEGLARRHVASRMPDIGMMVEVPAAALMLDRFENADFFSLGTNDLAQYLSAAARDSAAASSLYEQTRPALLRLIRQTVAMADMMGKPIGICGDLAGIPDALSELLACGLKQFSVAPQQLAALKTALHHTKTGS
ncbi:PEP-utilizing enzyme [Rhizobium sp. 32-5/1]|uniref:putative PEP-binding protein n=1 Tax=Rhizobium sp. 32-5/1 TaxID=3019602 RepID=UPI00240D2C39|nr:putative PEP-binding protein [Rhizobium sp. 32-5/1]WEZ82437.1 PEP-utilizing enzyme [Rhizobium sp. 32-5/1]